MSEEKIVLTDEEKKVIEEIGDSVYTPDFVEHWVNRHDSIFANAVAALQSMGAEGFLKAVRGVIRARNKE